MSSIDHLVATAATVEEGAARMEAAPGRPFRPGGRHAALGTHDRIVGPGEAGLEAVAVGPDADAPGRRRRHAPDGRARPPALDLRASRADHLDAALGDVADDARIVVTAELPGLRAEIDAPDGPWFPT